MVPAKILTAFEALGSAFEVLGCRSLFSCSSSASNDSVTNAVSDEDTAGFCWTGVSGKEGTFYP